jgi:serine/threonine protein kinase
MSPAEGNRVLDGEPAGADDPRLLAAVQEYHAALEAGGRPSRQDFLARHPEIAAELSECLDGLAFLWSAAGQLSRPAADLPAPEVDPLLQSPLGDYRIVREIGRGGMGVVYEAVQLSLGRRVALKVLPFAAALDARQLQRFRNEAQAAALLHHPNIVPVYAVGCERGVHYYAMQLVDGQTLAVLVRQLRQLTGRDQAADPEAPTTSGDRVNLLRPRQTAPGTAIRPAPQAAATPPVTGTASTLLTGRPARGPAYFRTMAGLGLQAAEALEHAHQLGVVHRDVKPANLLLDGRGNLWVTDFGLAQFHTDAALTRTGDLVGTLRYMSPEQALGRGTAVDHRADIYSLGVTLYELLTLRPAVGGTDRHDVLRRIGSEEPPPPRALDRAIPVELETVVLKAMAKEPAERYRTAQELADDLRRFLADEPVRARRPGLWERARKWSRRHRSLTVSAAVLLLLAAAGSSAGALLLAREQARTQAAYEGERHKAREASEQRARAEKEFRRAREEVDFFTQLAEDELAGKPQLAEVRRKFLEASLDYYQGFIKDCRDDPATRAELAAARGRVSAILRELAALEKLRRVLYLAALLREPAVRADLNLTEDQAGAVGRLSGDFFREPPAALREQRRLSPEEKRKQLEEGARARETALARLLTRAQGRRLRQIALRQRGPYAFSDPAVAEALRLSAAQKDFIYAAQARARRARFEQFRRGGGPGRRWLHAGPGPGWDGLMDEILAQLTDGQRARWDEMIGQPLNGPVRVHYHPGLFPRR